MNISSTLNDYSLYHTYNVNLKDRDIEDSINELDKSKVSISYTDEDKNSNDKVAVAFRDAKKSGSDDEMVVINIDRDTYDKLQSKYSDENFITNENGVVVLDNDVEQYVSNWYNELAYTQGYLQADNDGNGVLSDSEYGQLKSGFDMKLSYTANGSGGVYDLQGQIKERGVTLSRMNYSAETNIEDMISKYDEATQQKIKEMYGLEIEQSHRADPYLKEMNSLFHTNRPQSLEEAMSQTLSNDKDTDGNLTINELSQNKSLFKDIDEESKLTDFANNDFRKNHLKSNFNLWGNNLFGYNNTTSGADKIAGVRSEDEQQQLMKQNPSQMKEIEDIRVKEEKSSTVSESVNIMTVDEKIKLIDAIEKFALGENERQKAQEENSMNQNLEVLNSNFDFFIDTYEKVEKKEEEKSKEDEETEQEIQNALIEAISTLDEETAQEVKKSIYASREMTSSFGERKEEYLASIIESAKSLSSDKSIDKSEQNILAKEMVYLDEFLDKNSIEKDDFLSSDELQEEFRESIKGVDSIDIAKDIVQNRDLSKDEWRLELEEIYEYYDSQKFLPRDENHQDSLIEINSSVKDVISSVYSSIYDEDISKAIDEREEEQNNKIMQERLDSYLKVYEEMQNSLIA
jgi:hypothetical protein